MNISIIVLLLAISFIQAYAGLLGGGFAGGWTPTEPSDEGVVRSAHFAMDKEYPTRPSFVVVEASKQVVAGMNYDFIVQITPVQKPCFVHHFRVWDRFGSLSLTESNNISDRECV